MKIGTETGSLVNHVLSGSVGAPEPKVGMGRGPRTPPGNRMKKTIQDKLAEALVARGEREVTPSKSGKYRQFTAKMPGPNGKERSGEERYFWLGSSGALRFGRTSTSSTPLSATYKKWLLARRGYAGRFAPAG